MVTFNKKNPNGLDWYTLVTNQKKIDIMCPFIQHELTHVAAEKNIIYLLATAPGQNNGCTTLSTNLYMWLNNDTVGRQRDKESETTSGAYIDRYKRVITYKYKCPMTNNIYLNILCIERKSSNRIPDWNISRF